MCHINGRHLLVSFTSDMSYDNIWCQRRVLWRYLWLVRLVRIPSRSHVIFLFGLLFNSKTFFKYTLLNVVTCI